MVAEAVLPGVVGKLPKGHRNDAWLVTCLRERPSGFPTVTLRNGQRLYETRKRGLTVVDLWPNMTVALMQMQVSLSLGQV